MCKKYLYVAIGFIILWPWTHARHNATRDFVFQLKKITQNETKPIKKVSDWFGAESICEVLFTIPGKKLRLLPDKAHKKNVNALSGEQGCPCKCFLATRVMPCLVTQGTVKNAFTLGTPGAEVHGSSNAWSTWVLGKSGLLSETLSQPKSLVITLKPHFKTKSSTHLSYQVSLRVHF